MTRQAMMVRISAGSRMRAIAAQQMSASRRDVECQLGNEVQTGEMALFALEVSILRRLAGDGVLVLIPFDHCQRQRGARCTGSRTCAHPRRRLVSRSQLRSQSGATSVAIGRNADSAGPCRGTTQRPRIARFLSEIRWRPGDKQLAFYKYVRHPLMLAFVIAF